MSRRLWIAIALFTAASTLDASDNTVHITGGLISGTSGKISTVHGYKGVPYAAPPVGQLRWKAPQPPTPWEGVWPALDFSSECMQVPFPSKSIYYQLPRPMSEDCLYLNVWTGANSVADRRPVVFWIHGGGYGRGAGDVPAYDGELLASKGLVVVTVNYRLNIFGFFAHPQLRDTSTNSSGNYGLLDIVAALQWVRQNIAAFGGDPERVTIFGESTGSTLVTCLMASPLAKGLFQRAMGQSGGAFGNLPALSDAEREGVDFATKAGAANVADLRRWTAEDLMARSADDYMKLKLPFRPSVDGWFLPEDPSSTFAKGQQNDVPLVVGYNADEFTALMPWPQKETAATMISKVREQYGTLADDFLKAYTIESDAQAVEAVYDSLRDRAYGWQMRAWARAQVKTGRAPVYMYYFTRIPPGPAKDRYRSYHGAEMQYLFGNFTSAWDWQDTDRRLSEAMIRYLVNFAARGNPNSAGLPVWPAYDSASDQCIEFGNQIVSRAGVNKIGLDFFDRFNSAQLSAQSHGDRRANPTK